jgi:hypothetical protein
MAVSKGLPPDFGVLADPNEPKDAKAPDPRPKALDAPPVGDITALPGVLLKGLDLPCDDLTVALREPGSPPPKPLAPLEGVLRESFDELEAGKSVTPGCAVETTHRGESHTWFGESIDYPLSLVLWGVASGLCSVLGMRGVEGRLAREKDF